ncbi:MAG: hypothetical protein GY772_19840 [bacterium]|nr:hypothetical protein [bacterium]
MTATMVVEHLLEATAECLPVSRSWHVARATWDCYCGGCRECASHSDVRDEALHLARRCWQRAARER